jgi:TonB family protein
MTGWNESQWFAFAGSVAFKSAVVLGAAWLAAWTLRRRSAASRHLLWTAASVAVLALPVLMAALPALTLRSGGILDSGAWLLSASSTAGQAGTAPVAMPYAAGRGQSATRGTAPWRPDWRLWIMLLWAAGAAVAALQLAIACGGMWRVRRRSRRFAEEDLVAELSRSLGIGHTVDVLENSRSSMPMTYGLLRPAVFLPEDAADWPEERRRMVLLHELAHVRRGDAATHWLARAAVNLYWWNPLAWLAWRAFLKERELAADDMVLASGARASEYAMQLLEVARGLQSTPAMGCAAVAMARRSQLEGRMLAILDPAVRRGAPRRLAGVAAALVAVALVAPLAAVHAQQPADATQSPDVDATIRAAAAQQNHALLDQAAKAAVSQGKLDLAQQFLDASLGIREQVSGQSSVDYGVGLVKLAALAQRRGRTDEAASLYTRALQALGDRPEAAPALLEMGVLSLARRDADGAFGYFQRAERADPAYAQTALMWMAVVKARQPESASEAESLFQRALSQPDADPWEKAATLDLYAGLLRRTGRADEADAVAAQAGEVRNAARKRPTVAAKNDLPPGVYRVGDGVAPPVPIYRKEPDYSEEARLAKYSGEVVVSLEIGPDGVPSNIQIVRGLGLGLDEKAVDAVSQWRFTPGTRNGVPVTVMAQVAINFRLL